MTDLKIMILEYITKCKKKLSFLALKKALNISSEESDSLKDVLDELELDGLLYLNDCEEYMPMAKDSTLSVGEIRVDSRQRPFVLSGSNMIFIPNNCLHGAITGDIVLVKRNNHEKIPGDPVIVRKILKRQKGELIFEYKNIDGKLSLRPYNSPFKIPLLLSKRDEERLVEGDRVLVKVNLENKNGIYEADLLSIICHKDDKDKDIKTIAASYGIHSDFPIEVERELLDIPGFVSEEEIQARIANGGRDLRDKLVFTMDGKDTKDIDDAISLEINSKGNYVLGVHIADVSHYVKEGSAIYQEAIRRGTSYYFVDSVIPMLPFKISNGICSLNPNVDRLAMTCQIEIDHFGNVVNYEIFESIINSKKQMAYSEINDIFDNGAPIGDYLPYFSTLQKMFKLSDIMSKKKDERGYINFGDNEIKIRVDSEGKPTQVMLLTRGSSEKLIENFMLTANEVVASYPSDTFIAYVDLPSIYRIHEAPNAKRIQEVVEYLQNSGYRIKNANYQNPFALQDILRKLSELDDFPIVADILLRGLSRARYSTSNSGHFGLGLDYYTHFTAPIRRCSDLQTHHNLRNYTQDNLLSLDTTEEAKKMTEICVQATKTEKNADQAERAINYYKMAELMEKYIGQTFDGQIIYISRNGVNIKTTEHVNGTISMQDLNDLGFYLDDTFTRFRNTHDGHILKLGDFVNITVKYANKHERKINFALNYAPLIEHKKHKAKSKKKGRKVG